MKNTISIILIFTCVFYSAQQTPLNSLYFQNLYMINSAEVGKTNQLKFNLSHRQQWVGFEGAPTTTWFTVQKKLNRNLNFGIRFNYDQISFFEKLQFDASGSYLLKIDKANELTFGLSLGMIQGSLVMNNMISTDNSDEILLNNGVNGVGFHSDFGIAYSLNKKLNIGISFPNLFTTSMNIEPINIDQTYDYKMHRIAYLSYELDMSSDVKFTPIILIRKAAGLSNQIDLIGNFNFQNNYWGGLGFRQQGGFLVNVGFSPIDNLNLTYSYEFNNSKIASFTSGSHELMLSFALKNKTKENPQTEENQEQNTTDDQEKESEINK